MKINEEILIFNFILGRAIAQWGYVELHLLEVAFCCVNDADRSAFAVSYHSIEGFRQKLNMCDNLVGHRLRKSQHFDRWAALRKTLGKASVNRNKLAHGWHKLYSTNIAGRRCAIIPIHHEDGTLLHVEGAKPPTGALCVRDLFAIHSEFHELTARTANMVHLFCRDQAPFPESHGPQGRPPTIAQIKDLIHAELGFQFAPSRRKS